MTRRPIHIAFLARDFLKWSGGVWFSQNLLRGLASLPPEAVRITVFASLDNGWRQRARAFAGRIKRAVLRPSRAASILFARSRHDLARNGIRQLASIVPRVVVFDGSDASLARQCAAQDVDVVMPAMTPPANLPLPWVGYLYDCQHKHLPEFFERGEIERRDRAFAEMLERAPVVFANAQSVIADLRHWFPGSRSSLAALPFAALVDEAELAAAVRNAPAAHERYTAGRPYFIICNQFWAHKDHATAFRAFAKFGASPLRERWRLVCTGLTEDYRAPDYFAGLLALVDELGLRDRIVFTGFIDRSLQQSLLFGAAALVQPTLFEGGPGGGAAADAIALGVPCLLSDIDPNRELSSPLATFFRVRDADALASAMETIAANPPVRPSTGQILASSRCYERRLGEALFSLAERALAA